MDEIELNQRFRDGDDEAVSEIYERYGRAMYTIAISVLRDRDLASECVQRAFVNAWRASATFDVNRDLRPWLATITRRAAFDIYRSRSRRNKAESSMQTEPVVPGVGIERTWEKWQVRNALDELPTDEREIVRLAHFEGLSHAEIARKLGIPHGTVKSRSHRAHRNLARALLHLVQLMEAMR